MFAVKLVPFLIFSYFLGSVNFAIILTKLINGQDIRKIGNLNPGAMNVLRNIGKGWGLLVLFLDALKSFIPLVLARLFAFTGNSAADFLALFAIGLFALGGHCRPVFYKFRGGGGIATYIGIFIFFLPVEFAASMLLGGIVIALFVKNVEFRWGRFVPIMFVTIIPFLTLATSFLENIPLFAHISIFGHPWYFIVGAFAVSIFTLLMNLNLVGNSIKEAKS